MSKGNARQEDAKPQAIEKASPIMINSKALAKENSLHILHVDDDVCLLEVSKQILSDENNFEIENVTSVDEAFKKMERQTFDAIVSDYEMPIKNGLEFLKELRNQKLDLPFILFTGKGREDVAVKALNLGADSYLNKNGPPETVYCELADTINKTVERKKSRKMLAKSEAKYRALVESSLQGISILQVAPLRIVFANNAMGKILGYSPHELMTLSSEGIMGLAHRDDRALFFGRMEKRLRGEQPGACYEFRGVQKDGSIIWMSALANRVDYEGQPAVQGMFLDINENKKFEESLKESEQKFRTLSEELPNMIFINKQGRVAYANKKCEDITGYTREELYSPNFNFLTLCAPEYVDEMKLAYTRHMKNETVPPYEFALVTRDNKRLEVVITTKLMVYEGEKAILGIVTDITERKKNEAIQRESEEQFRQLFSSMPSGVVIYEAIDNGEDFVFRGFNAAAEKIEKKSKDEVLGKRVTQVFVGVKSCGILNIFQRVWRTGHPEYNPVALYKDDNELGTWRENWVYKLPNGNIIAIYNDITDRKKAEEIVRKSEERYRELANSVPEMVFECDLTGKITYISQRAIDFTGFTNEELFGKNMLDFLVPEDRKRAIENMKRSFMGENLGSTEYSLFRKDGTVYPTLVRTSRIISENKVVGLRGLVIEITERKKAEKALQESEIHYRLLAEREHITNEKLNVIGKLTRHDVRNKLSAVKANTYLLKKRVGANPEIANYIAAIEQSVEQTESLLEFSRIYEQIGTEQLKTVDVEECFNEAASFFPDLQNVKVTNECRGFSVMADSLLRQLFYNFIDNSMKHGEKISQIRLYYSKEGNEAKLFYEDDGVGISSANKPRTFSEGFTTGKGTGHGLYLVKRMMEVYGWKIEEAGEEGKGVKFVITIPETKLTKP